MSLPSQSEPTPERVWINARTDETWFDREAALLNSADGDKLFEYVRADLQRGAVDTAGEAGDLLDELTTLYLDLEALPEGVQDKFGIVRDDLRRVGGQ